MGKDYIKRKAEPAQPDRAADNRKREKKNKKHTNQKWEGTEDKVERQQNRSSNRCTWGTKGAGRKEGSRNIDNSSCRAHHSQIGKTKNSRNARVGTKVGGSRKEEKTKEK